MRRVLPRLQSRPQAVLCRAPIPCLMSLCLLRSALLVRPVLRLLLCPVLLLMCLLQLCRRLGREWSGVPLVPHSRPRSCVVRLVCARSFF